MVGAAPAENVVRERPAPGDVVVLLGGRTGRDGMRRRHRLLQEPTTRTPSTTMRRARSRRATPPRSGSSSGCSGNREVTRMIKRCNDFGAGGVSVAIGELADGLRHRPGRGAARNMTAWTAPSWPSPSPRSAWPWWWPRRTRTRFIAAAQAENLEAYPVAVVTESPRMVMTWNGPDHRRPVPGFPGHQRRGQAHLCHRTRPLPTAQRQPVHGGFAETCEDMASSLKCASRRGLTERFDGSIGAASVLMPFGGEHPAHPRPGLWPPCCPCCPARAPTTCSVMAWGFDPDTMVRRPLHRCGCLSGGLHGQAGGRRL